MLALHFCEIFRIPRMPASISDVLGELIEPGNIKMQGTGGGGKFILIYFNPTLLFLSFL